MSIGKKFIIGFFVVVLCLLIIGGFYFSSLPQNFLSVPFLTPPSLTPTPTPLLASTPTDKIVWHDMSDIKFTELDLNHLNKDLVETWLASASGTIDYHDPFTSVSVKVYSGKFKRLLNNSLIITQEREERQFSFPADSGSRLWKKTKDKLYVASPSLDQIVKYNLVGLELKLDDIVLVYEAKNINGTQNSNGIWLIVFPQN